MEGKGGRLWGNREKEVAGVDEGFTNYRVEGKEQLGCDLYLRVTVLGDTGSKAFTICWGFTSCSILKRVSDARQGDSFCLSSSSFCTSGIMQKWASSSLPLKWSFYFLPITNAIKSWIFPHGVTHPNSCYHELSRASKHETTSQRMAYNWEKMFFAKCWSLFCKKKCIVVEYCISLPSFYIQ